MSEVSTSPYRGMPAKVHVLRSWREVNWGGELRVVGVVKDRFNGRPMMTAPILGVGKVPICVGEHQPDLLDDGMLVESVSGSRYLLDGRQEEPGLINACDL